MCCSTAITTYSRSIRSTSGTARRSSPSITDHADGRKIIVARGAEDDKGQLMTFIEACRAWKTVTGSLPLDVTILIEGEEESARKNFVPFLDATKNELKADFALVCDTGMWDPERPPSRHRCAAWCTTRSSSLAADRDLHSGVYRRRVRPTRSMC